MQCDDDGMQMMVSALQHNSKPRRFYITGKAKCRNSAIKTNTGAWFAHNGKAEVEFEEAECSNKSELCVCPTVGKLEYCTFFSAKCLLGPKFESRNPPRIRGKTTTGAIKLDAEITCAEPDFKLE